MLVSPWYRWRWVRLEKKNNKMPVHNVSDKTPKNGTVSKKKMEQKLEIMNQRKEEPRVVRRKGLKSKKNSEDLQKIQATSGEENPLKESFSMDGTTLIEVFNQSNAYWTGLNEEITTEIIEMEIDSYTQMTEKCLTVPSSWHIIMYMTNFHRQVWNQHYHTFVCF